MAIRVGLCHKTHYQYDMAVRLSPHVLRLRPAPHTRTPIEAYSLLVRPEKHFINWQQDPFGNFLARIVFPEKTTEFFIQVDLVARMSIINPFDFFVEDYAKNFPFAYDPLLAKELIPYLETAENGPLLQSRLSAVDKTPRNIVDFLVDLNRAVSQEIFYSIRLEPGTQNCEETLALKSGSCRDSAWLLVQIMRHLGLAARFVSGYLVQLTPDEKPIEGPAGVDQDFTDLHAWAEVYVPGAGWVGLDPTSGLFAGEGHIPLAATPSFEGAAPVTGASDSCETTFSYSNTIRRLFEEPRVTKPYTELEWDTILALGRQVEKDLRLHDVRLTLGGEPTFVSVEDMESPEWNTAALGPTKKNFAEALLQRLAARFTQGAVLYHGQGKWYPAEPLPRWSLGAFWRKDGLPVWQDPALLACEQKNYGLGIEDARKLACEIACHLGLDPARLVPGFEDTLYYLWREASEPPNVSWTSADMKSPEWRSELALALSRGLSTPLGFALPLAWDEGQKRWISAPWAFRRKQMFLTPGSSPMGLRLPLDSLPWVAPEERKIPIERDHFEPRDLLPDVHGEVAKRYSESFSSQENLFLLPTAPLCEMGAADEKMVEVPHTALCVEPRQGKIYVFLPPLTHVEHYLDLIASIEASAKKLGMPVLLEGYEPPQDFRLDRLSVTPDPGVIEVNIHPAANWDELVESTLGLYEEARQVRLAAEKFMLDGRHTGTGGGNHVTLGGPTPADSPFLRRPDLLASLVTYWQNHPSLSYLFSGLFIGPTSQAPRVDEARHESLYELEIALSEIERIKQPQPWLADRLLRHLLVDITGNTHRAEFCIDKLYSPDTARGRQGLVEFRGFEMPPHPQMSIVQMLLLRALIARFWKESYHMPLVRWGTELHDRFMLPHYVWCDFEEVLQDLRQKGFAFESQWFLPFFEFRFPHYGSIEAQDMSLEIRGALEPWHVLGEEATNVGTARFVDSSVERLQVKVTGFTPSRHLVACNGRQVPLRHTGRHGEYVAGVRFRAWQPPSALHPTIGVHCPLTFDIIDTWNGRAIGGCTYHVQHPGGRNPPVFPVNAFEAEARRFARFWPYGHTPGWLEVPPDVRNLLSQFFPEGHPPGPMAPPPEEAPKEYPHTLDLRCPPTIL